MDLFLTKQANTLNAVFESDREALNKLKDGETYKVKITRPRNPLFHRKFYALLNLAFENQDQFDNFEKFRFVMIMKAGYFESIKTDKGVVYMPKSISFSSMEQDEFERLYNDMIQVVIDLIGADEETIEKELINFF